MLTNSWRVVWLRLLYLHVCSPTYQNCSHRLTRLRSALQPLSLALSLSPSLIKPPLELGACVLCEISYYLFLIWFNLRTSEFISISFIKILLSFRFLRKFNRLGEFNLDTVFSNIRLWCTSSKGFFSFPKCSRNQTDIVVGLGFCGRRLKMISLCFWFILFCIGSAVSFLSFLLCPLPGFWENWGHGKKDYCDSLVTAVVVLKRLKFRVLLISTRKSFYRQ